MATFFDNPYSYLNEAMDAESDGEYDRSIANALVALATTLLALVDSDSEDSFPAAPIDYEDFRGGG